MMETYFGYVRTPADAIKLFEACRLGMLPRVQRRLSEKERQAIRSGSIFVWDEREAGMRRWTDGKSWSASRVSGSFLTYREMEGKRGSGFGSSRRGAGKTPDSGRGSDEDLDDGEPEGYRYKADGLMKQSFSITTQNGQHLHLISYFSRGQQELLLPTSDPALRHVIPAKGMYPESSLNEAPLPVLTRTPMPQQPYAAQPQHPSFPTQYPPPYWPPSPVATPPYSHGHYPGAQAYTQAHLPPPQHQYPNHQQPSHPQPPYPPGPAATYERASLPPPQPSAQLPPKHQMPLPQPYPQNSNQHPSHMSQTSRLGPIDSPRSQHLQAQAREAVQIDPRLGTNNNNNTRSPQGPLPALEPRPPHSQQPQQYHQNGHAQSPPPRALSTSPQRHPDAKGVAVAVTSASNKASLSALLLHPTPSNSEPNSANPGSGGSANSSPRTNGNGNNGMASQSNQSKRLLQEDARALGVLDKKFMI